MNERIGILAHRNPDELLKKKWVDWCVTAQTALDMSKEKPQGKQKVGKPIRRR